MENVIFEFYKGRTYARDLKIIGWSKPIDELYLTIKSNVEDKIYVLQKTLKDGIVLADEGFDEDNRKFRVYNIFLNATDTDTFQINKKYVFDIALMCEGIKLTLVTGTLRLKGTATATNNEREVG